jgi:hypothetical protein
MSPPNQFLLYTAPDGVVKVDVVVRDETVWLTQKALAELFGVKVPAINKHLKNIFDSGELTRAQLFPKWKQFEQKAPAPSPARSSLDDIVTDHTLDHLEWVRSAKTRAAETLFLERLLKRARELLPV